MSSWAFLVGLLHNNLPNKHLIMNDIDECDIQEILNKGRAMGVTMDYKWCNDLELEVENIPIDMVFIDTWHVYGQLKRELAKYSKVASKYIAMHDTTVDEFRGETLRCGLNAEEQSRATGIPVEEITKGLGPALSEFLRDNPNWVIEEKFSHNNGLTILKRLS